MSRWAVAVCACALGGVWVAAANAEERKALAFPSVEIVTPSRAEVREKIRHELEVQSKIDATDVELPDVVLYLADFHGIPIALDRQTLEEAGFDWHQTITAELEKITLRDLLDRILAPLGCEFVIHGDGLLITTADKAARAQQIQIYPVGDLAGSASSPATSADFEPLAAAVRSLVDAMPLADGAPAPKVIAIPQARSLVVVQNDSGQRQVAELLEGLAEARFLQRMQAKGAQ